MQIITGDKENIRRNSFNLTPRRSSPKRSNSENPSQSGLKVKVYTINDWALRQATLSFAYFQLILTTII